MSEHKWRPRTLGEVAPVNRIWDEEPWKKHIEGYIAQLKPAEPGQRELREGGWVFG
ncbi:hypothetical protein V5O48_002373 [Marasmius crinis-equi]|uniref:Uncharacterized protein n=1 Tax=Marasmius crinis-equi TaxID=585013 RepID=A0ABR3FWU1_9AGAR